MGKSKAILILNVPGLIVCDFLFFLLIAGELLFLFEADLGKERIGVFRVFWLVPVCVVNRLSVTDEVELHDVCVALLWNEARL